jgi:hypothetical protein
MSDGLEFSVQVLRRADVVGSSCEGSDDTAVFFEELVVQEEYLV